MDWGQELANNGLFKAAAGGIAAVLVAFVGYQLQLGGRRRRRRREIREELELVALLGDRPEAAPLKARADALLTRYSHRLAPTAAEQPGPPWWATLLSVVASTAGSRFVSLWALLAIVGCVLLGLVLALFVYEGIRDARAANAAELAAWPAEAGGAPEETD